MYVQPDGNWESIVSITPGLISYQLLIKVKKPQNIQVGRLGHFHFPVGKYVYTGSATQNLVARVRCHLKTGKSLHWHIDYLLDSSDVHVAGIKFSGWEECRLNQLCDGEILMPGFGASDCRHRCGSHLKYLGGRQ